MNSNLQPAFRALSDPTRRAILLRLRNADLTITEVVDQFDLTRTAVRKHITILEEGELITVTPRGRERVTSLNPDGVKPIADWFSYFNQYWDDALNSLKSVIEKKELEQAHSENHNNNQE